jgi:hypothetical protein
VVHVPTEQARVAPVHAVAPLQQGWFSAPHETHEPLEQTVLDALHEFAAQQGWFSPPHATHEPPVQIDPFAHTLPQQGWPAAPHAAQIFDVLQVAPVLQFDPQHG